MTSTGDTTPPPAAGISLAEADLIVRQYIAFGLYDEQKASLWRNLCHLSATLAELSRCVPAASFLDVGGSGLFLSIMRNFFGVSQCVGTVLSKDGPGRLVKPIPFGERPEDYPFLTVDFANSTLAVEDATFDLALCAGVIGHMPADPLALLVELNRVMSVGGRVVMTTPNICSYRAIAAALKQETPVTKYRYNINGSPDRHYMEYSPALLRQAVYAAGFDVAGLRTVNSWSTPDPEIMQMVKQLGFSTQDRGDNIIAVCQKAGPVRVRYPAALYK